MDVYINAESLSSYTQTPLILFSFHHREEIPPEEDQREKAAHKGVYRQAAAVGHLEDGERVLWVCPGAVPVCQGTRCQRKGRGTLPAGAKLLLWENLPQKLKDAWRSDVESKMKKRRKVRLIDCWWLCGWFVRVIENTTWSCRTIHLWQRCYSRPCQPTGRGACVSSAASAAGCVPSSPRASTPFHFHFKGRLRRGPQPAHVRRQPVQQLVRLLIGFAPIQTKHFHWLCTVWLCLVVF